MTLRDELIAVIVERLKAYCDENRYDAADFDFDLDEFEFLSLADVMVAFIRAEGEGFDQAAFVRDVRAGLAG